MDINKKYIDFVLTPAFDGIRALTEFVADLRPYDAKNSRQMCGYDVRDPHYVTVEAINGRYRQSMHGNPTPLMVKFMETKMLPSEAKYFNIIIHDNGDAFLFCKYDQIIGSRRIAQIDPKTIPTF